MIVVVMGVSGSGKSTIGAALASAQGWPFLEGDALHPAANVAKMAAGHPLTDEDRVPWLAAIGRRMDAWTAAGTSGVVACSALRRSYRDALRGPRNGRRGGPGGVRFVLLDVDREDLLDRLRHRHGHFMPPELLDSQLATLERPGPDERAVIVRLTPDMSPAQAVERIRTELRLPVA
ncbi:MAG TPA: gluconokinase [Micromonosporaceae bacterium]|nr:gluconokinase [Micromonosporaceae bacterium]